MGKGGSRYGAGRPGYRGKAEHLQRVEIGRWHRGGYLHAGTRFTWSWNCGGDPTGSIGVQVFGPDSLRLQYAIVGDDDRRRDASLTIRIDHTSCNYGGSRPWFVCPVCHHRAGVLYLRAGRFACRCCNRVAYVSQSCDALDWMWRKEAKIEARLGDNWRRPKGMRRRTHDRLIEELVDCEDRRSDAFCTMALRMFGVDMLKDIASG
jgi:hypothetical protein